MGDARPAGRSVASQENNPDNRQFGRRLLSRQATRPCPQAGQVRGELQMSRPGDKPADLQAGANDGDEAMAAPDAQRDAGTGAGTAAGARATGTSGTGGPAAGSRESGTTGSTTTAMRGRAEQRQDDSAGSYQTGRAPAHAYRGGGAETAAGGGMTGAVLSVVAGLLTFLAGLAAVVRQHFYPVLSGYAYTWNVRNWGWVLLVLGIVLFAAGACALLGMAWARAAAIGLAILTAIAGFLFLVYTPFWGVIIVAVSVFAIWGLLRDATADGQAM